MVLEERGGGVGNGRSGGNRACHQNVLYERNINWKRNSCSNDLQSQVCNWIIFILYTFKNSFFLIWLWYLVCITMININFQVKIVTWFSSLPSVPWISFHLTHLILNEIYAMQCWSRHGKSIDGASVELVYIGFLGLSWWRQLSRFLFQESGRSHYKWL